MEKQTTLVLLPGLDGTEVLMRPLIGALPASIRPVVVTYPTLGDNSYEALLFLAQRAVASVGECIVLGWSFAGPLALMLAAAEPHKVRGVILAASFVRSPSRLLSRLRFALAGPPVWAWRAARRLPLWLFKPKSNALRLAKSETWRRVPASVVAARLRAIHSVDVSALLRRCRQPVLYIASSQDGIVPRHNAHHVLQLLPSAQFVTIAGPHLALFTNPQAAARVIGEFSHQAVTAFPVYRAASA